MTLIPNRDREGADPSRDREGADPLAERLRALRSRTPRGVALGLDATRGALAALGDPHLAVPCVHVAGSNGKGSTSAMVESIARAAGLRTGLYTSPHLSRVAEVVRIDGEVIGDDALARSLGLVLDRCDAGLTVFEALTVAAFHAIAEAGVDLAIVEVGLGGRGDATNVIERPLCAAVTSIALEHTAQLGGTIALIAREKAGILKPGAPAVIGPVGDEAARAIEEAARDAGAGPLWWVTRGDARGADAIHVKDRGDGAATVTPPASRGGDAVTARPALSGPHQLDNAAVAVGIAWRLADRWPRVAGSIEASLASARWPGRMERVAYGAATLLLDCAHNAHGAAALARALGSEAGEGCDPARTTLLFGALGDKAWPDMLSSLAPLASRRVYTTPPGRSPAPLDDLRAFADGEAIADPIAALDRAAAITPPGGIVVVTGSIYLVGAVRSAALGIAYDPPFAVDLGGPAR